MKYDILNNGGSIAGTLSLAWTAYALDDKGNVYPVATASAQSDSVNHQLEALYSLQSKIVEQDRDVILRDITITGESLSIPISTQSPVKQWIISKMQKP